MSLASLALALVLGAALALQAMRAEGTWRAVALAGMAASAAIAGLGVAIIRISAREEMEGALAGMVAPSQEPEDPPAVPAGTEPGAVEAAAQQAEAEARLAVSLEALATIAAATERRAGSVERDVAELGRADDATGMPAGPGSASPMPASGEAPPEEDGPLAGDAAVTALIARASAAAEREAALRQAAGSFNDAGSALAADQAQTDDSLVALEDLADRLDALALAWSRAGASRAVPAQELASALAPIAQDIARHARRAREAFDAARQAAARARVSSADAGRAARAAEQAALDVASSGRAIGPRLEAESAHLAVLRDRAAVLASALAAAREALERHAAAARATAREAGEAVERAREGA